MRVRPKVIVSLFNRQQVLLSEIQDPHRQKPMYLPVGGEVEFQESLLDAALREVREELGVVIPTPTFQGFMESTFELNARPHHEIVFHFTCAIDDTLRAAVPDHGVEADGATFPVYWFDHDTLISIKDALVPRSLFRELQPWLL